MPPMKAAAAFLIHSTNRRIKLHPNQLIAACLVVAELDPRSEPRKADKFSGMNRWKKPLLSTCAMLTLCYLGACFVVWDFPNPYENLEPMIRYLWLLSTAGLALMTFIYSGPKNG